MIFDGMDLGYGLWIENELGIADVDARMDLSRDNTPLIWEQASSYRPFDLIGGSNRGVLTRSQLDAIKAKAAVPGATYTMVYNGESRTVRFRTWDPPVIEAEPLGPRERIKDSDIYTNIRIKLMEA